MFDCGVNLLSDRLDPIETIAESSKAGLSGLLIISSTLEESLQAKNFCHKHNADTFKLRFTAGVHPHNASSWTEHHYSELKLLVEDDLCVAIGECGLDFNRNFSTPEEQEFAFVQQLKLADDTGMGVYLHERDALHRQVALLKQHGIKAKFKVAHCFTGGKSELSEYLALGCHIGITGWVCDAKRGADLRTCISHIPQDKMLVETDAPFLFPKTVKPRASNNHPKYLIHIINEIAELIVADADIVKQITERNALTLFK